MTQIIRAQKGVLVALAVTFGAAGGAHAADAKRADVLKAVVDCRAVADNVARLACFDAAAARLDEAEAKGDVVVLDREQRQEARREAFGFTLPSLDILNRGEGEEKMDRAAFTVSRAWKDSDGKWMIELDSGAVWRQADTKELFKAPHKGSTVEIRSASLGSYFMNIDGQTAIRAKRER